MKQHIAWAVVIVIMYYAVLSNTIPHEVNGVTGAAVTGEEEGAPTTPEQAIAAYPELFSYGNEKNRNLISAVSSISSEFKAKGVDMTPELLAAVMATLTKEVGGTFLPVEERWDYCAGPASTATIGGERRSEEYNGGCDYKG